MAFRVTAPLVLVAGVEVPHAYRGRVLSTIPDPVQRAQWLEQGMVEEIPDALPPGVAADPPAAPVPAPALERPAATATTATWIAYIVATGAATAEEAGKLSKNQLIELAG